MPSSLSARVAIACLPALAAAACDRQSAAPGQANGAPDAANVISADEVTAPSAAATIGLDRSHRGEPAPAAAFKDPAGKPVTLKALAGKPMLVNLWATWCGPCVAELPTLAKAVGTVRIVAISQDMQAGATVPAFLKAHGAPALAPYLDDHMALSLGYGASLPMTILFDSAGREVWRWHGGNDWASPAARALIAEAR